MEKVDPHVFDWIKRTLEEFIDQGKKRLVLLIGPEERVVRYDERFVIGGLITQLDRCLQRLKVMAAGKGLLRHFFRSVKENGAIEWEVVLGQNQNQDLRDELNSLIELSRTIPENL